MIKIKNKNTNIKKIIAFILLFMMILPNLIAFASVGGSHYGDVNKTPPRNNGSTTTTPGKGDSSNNTPGSSGTKPGSSGKPNPATKPANYYRTIPRSVQNNIVSSRNSFFSSGQKYVRSAVGAYKYLVFSQGQAVGGAAKDKYYTIQGSYTAIFSDTNRVRTSYRNLRPQDYKWTVTGGPATYKKVTYPGNEGQYIRFHQTGYYTIVAKETLVEDICEERRVTETVVASHNGSTLRTQTVYSPKKKVGTRNKPGLTTRWTEVFIGPDDVDKDIPIDPFKPDKIGKTPGSNKGGGGNKGGGNNGGGGKGFNEKDIEIDYELVE